MVKLAMIYSQLMADLVIVSNCEIYGKALIAKGKSIFHNRHFLEATFVINVPDSSC
jgi:hypothetical protein